MDTSSAVVPLIIKEKQFPNFLIMNDEQIEEYFSKLQKIVDVAIDKAKQDKDAYFAGVNIADLRCIECGVKITLHEDNKYFALISEASPDAHEFISYVHNYIENNHPEFLPIEIVCEW